MPTVGWIYEGTIDRFWEEQPKSTLGSAPKRVFVCKCCGKELFSLEELRRHYSFDHPLELPVLYIHGEPLLRESVIRSPFSKTDVELVQCDMCRVQADGGVWRTLAIDDFRSQMTIPRHSTWTVQLIHTREIDEARAEEEYHIRFRIPDKDTLNTVDELFIRCLVVDELRHSDLEIYETNLPTDAPAREYGSALGDYALGIILKERRSPTYAPVGFEEFAVKMRSALEVLKLFNRPVALAVSGSIRFNLNDFSHTGLLTTPELAAGLHYFKNICTPVSSVTGNSLATEASKQIKRAVCPVDQVTDHLLSACTTLSNGNKLSMSELEALRQLLRGMAPVSEQDMSKIHVICAEGFSRLDRYTEALPHLQAIQFDPILKEWAQYRLEDISTHEH